jgi:hypothetical protein
LCEFNKRSLARSENPSQLRTRGNSSFFDKLIRTVNAWLDLAKEINIGKEIERASWSAFLLA